MRLASLLLLLLACALPARAQVTSVADDFSDGSFASNPAWTGETGKWTVAPRSGNPALTLSGSAAADTASLVTPSNVSFGTWRVRYFFDFNQTTANGARIYLMSSSANLRGPLQGYYLQIGTNNNDEVRLVRQDGDTRTQIGNAVAAAAVGNSGVVDLVATRDGAGAWTVNVTSSTDAVASTTGTIAATDATYTASAFFGVWSKHSTTANRAQAFDDVNVSGQTGPPDVAPPSVVSSGYDAGANVFSIAFSEPVRTSTLTAANVAFSGATPYALEPTGTSGATATGVRLRFSAPPPPGTYTVTVQGVQDAAGNTMDATQLSMPVSFAGAVPAGGDLIVNEIHFAPPAGQTEFVELFNRSAKTFNLADFRFCDNTGCARVVTAQPVVVAPGAYVVLAQNAAAFQATFPGVAAVQPPSWPSLNNDADASVLKFAAAGGTFPVIDSVAYRVAPGQAVAGVSYERKDPDGPGVPSNFAPSAAAAGATPGARNSVFFVDTLAPAIVSAVETAPQTVAVTFNEPVQAASLAGRFSVGGVAPSSVALSADGLTATLAFAAPLPASALAVAAGVRDLKGNAAGAATVPIGRLAAPGDLVVNEVHYDPLADDADGRPDQPEFVELYNPSNKPVSLAGLLLVGAVNERGLADTTRLAAAAPVLPGGYVVVYRLSGAYLATASPDSLLRAAYPSLPASALLVPVRSPFTLPNDGGRVAVLTPQRVVVDDVTYSPRWHSPTLRTAKGVSLERRAAAAPSNEPTNWGSSPAPEGATPGRRNALTLDPSDPSVPQDAGLSVEPSPFSPDGDGDEDVTFLRYRLRSDLAAATLRVRIYNVAGRLVRTLTAAQLAGPVGQLEWDGRDDDGRGLALGPYVVLLDAVDARGGTTEAYRKVVTLARHLH